MFIVIVKAGAYRVPVPVPKMNFRFFGTGQVQTSAPYRIRKCVPSLNLNSGVTQFWDEKSRPRNTPISRTKKTRPRNEISVIGVIETILVVGT